MKKIYFLIALSLLFCLFIYVFYRMRETVVTSILISFISFETYEEYRGSIVRMFPLNHFTIFSLPEGLWVFCWTLTAKRLFLPVRKANLDLTYIPLIFSVGLEFLQMTPLNKGQFQIWDLVASVVFWLIAKFLFTLEFENQHIFKPINQRSLAFIFLFSIVFLAHVWG